MSRRKSATRTPRFTRRHRSSKILLAVPPIPAPPDPVWLCPNHFQDKIFSLMPFFFPPLLQIIVIFHNIIIAVIDIFEISEERRVTSW